MQQQDHNGSNEQNGIDSEVILSADGEFLRFATVVVAIFTAVIILFAFWSGKDTKFEELALGEFTSSVYGKYNNEQIHCRDVTDADDCLEPAAARSLSKSILWLGNSQLHGINNAKLGDQPASTLLANKWRPRGVEVLAFSQPNASLREHYVLFEYLLSRQNFDILLLPVVFDDTREGAIRSEIALGAEDDMVHSQLSSTVAGRSIIKIIGSSAGPNRQQIPEKTLQDESESWIISQLEICCGWKTLRQEAAGSIKRNIYYTRNSIFDINPTTQRRRLPATYQSNLAAFEEILQRAWDNGIHVVVYIAPLRTDVAPPYDPAEYIEFKRSISEIVTQKGAQLLDLEKLVPGQQWGSEGTGDTKEGLDFMHFQHAGHILLSQAINNVIEEKLR